MSIERKIAWCDWIGGMIIGLMPLLAHGVLWIGTKGQAGWSDNWAPDILFVTISNSGLAAISVFGRRLAGVGGPLKPGRRKLTPRQASGIGEIAYIAKCAGCTLWRRTVFITWLSISAIAVSALGAVGSFIVWRFDL
jgi:hypothetical protein